MSVNQSQVDTAIPGSTFYFVMLNEVSTKTKNQGCNIKKIIAGSSDPRTESGPELRVACQQGKQARARKTVKYKGR